MHINVFYYMKLNVAMNFILMCFCLFDIVVCWMLDMMQHKGYFDKLALQPISNWFEITIIAIYWNPVEVFVLWPIMKMLKKPCFLGQSLEHEGRCQKRCLEMYGTVFINQFDEMKVCNS